MPFTAPVGNFQPPATGLVRPSSVVDTVGPGSISNSNKAYDSDPNSYGVWVGIQPSSGPVMTYSTYVVSASGSTLGHSIYAVMSSDNPNSPGAGYILVSVDNGATYPYGCGRYFGLANSQLAVISSCLLPDGILFSNIKVKTSLVAGHGVPVGNTTDLRVYDIYIQ